MAWMGDACSDRIHPSFFWRIENPRSRASVSFVAVDLRFHRRDFVACGAKATTPAEPWPSRMAGANQLQLVSLAANLRVRRETTALVFRPLCRRYGEFVLLPG